MLGLEFNHVSKRDPFWLVYTGTSNSPGRETIPIGSSVGLYGGFTIYIPGEIKFI